MKTKEVLIPVPKMALQTSDNIVEQVYTVHILGDDGVVGPPTRFRVKSTVVDNKPHIGEKMPLGSC